MSVFIDLTGQRFGKLIAIKFMGRVNFHSMFHCLCDCGGMSVVTSNNLRRQHTTSCGCESSKVTIGKRSKTHGLRKHPLYESWIGMRNRCYWPQHNRYQYYGGKGVEVCDEWVDSFVNFYKWALANGWKKGLQIDRKENDKNYCPENCKFSNVKEQCRNRTSNVRITVDGVTRILIEWSELTKTNPMTIKGRLKRGWSEKESVFGKSS